MASKRELFGEIFCQVFDVVFACEFGEPVGWHGVVAVVEAGEGAGYGAGGRAEITLEMRLPINTSI